MPNLHYVPQAHRFHPKVSANKQETGKVTADTHPNLFERLPENVQNEQEVVYSHYKSLLELGVPKEVARINTPVSRYSKMMAKANIRNWFAFLNLRMRPDAQWEIRQYAMEVAKLIKERWPSAYKLFEEYDLYGAHFSRTELKILRALLRNWASDDLIAETARGAGLSGQKEKEFLDKLQNGGLSILA